MTSPTNMRVEKIPRSHESIFLEHYAWLLERARHIADGTSEDPQDLVQELYIGFVQMKASPNFSDASAAQAYLRRALKNLFTSRRIRLGRDATTRLALVDFDSLESALVAVDRRQLLNVRSDLARIAEYILIRRTTSKGATAFIMRFFFGYLPSEIMSLLKLNRKSFEKMLLTARLEAKAYVERPHVLRFLHHQEKNIPAFSNVLPEETQALFAELQGRMFFEPIGPHQMFDDFARIYSSVSETLTLEQTAHLGSCRLCLLGAGQVLGIPDLLLQLFPEPAAPGGPTPTSGGIEDERLKKLRRKGRETFEHRPSKLQIIVDGELRGVQAVTGAESRLQLTLKPFSKPEFIEIRSEQGVSMLYLDMQENADLLEERVARADFSENRTLSASFRLAEGAPILEVYYYDPLWEYPEDADSLETASPIANEARQTTTSALRSLSRPPLRDTFRWVVELQRIIGNRKTVGAVAVSVILLAGILLPKSSKHPAVVEAPPTAHQLLTFSLNNTTAAMPDGGGSRAIYDFERSEVSGDTSTRQTVEAVRSKSHRSSSLRLLSPSGTLLDGRRTDSSGDIRSTKRERSDAAANNRESEPPIWTHIPDVEDFLALAGESSISVIHSPTGYDLGFKRTAPHATNVIVGVHMELAASGYRPVREDIEVREANRTATYHFVEVSYRLLSPAELEQEERRALVPMLGRGGPLNTGGKISDASLALHALEILQQDKEAEGAIDLERIPLGTVRLSGVLSSANAKDALIHKLRNLKYGEQLVLDIHSSEDISKQTDVEDKPAHSILTSVRPTERTAPWVDLLRDPASREMPIDPLQEDMLNQTAARLVADGTQFHREVWLTASIAARWLSGSELQSLSPKDKRLWILLVGRHLNSADIALQDVVHSLHLPVDVTKATPPIANIPVFAAESERLLQNGEKLDRLLSSGFAVADIPVPHATDSGELPPLVAVLLQQESRLNRVVERLR